MRTDRKKRSASALRMTRQRRLILEQLQAPGAHPTANELYVRVRRELPKISLGTVYRNLEMLARVGPVRRLQLGGGQKRYDGDLHRHYHVRCAECGKIRDVSGNSFPDLDAVAGGASDFKILGHHLGFEGLCKECTEKPRTRTSS